MDGKIYKISGYLVDPNGDVSTRDIFDRLKHLYDMSGKHIHVIEADLPDWTDENPLNNYEDCDLAECEKYFRDKYPVREDRRKYPDLHQEYRFEDVRNAELPESTGWVPCSKEMPEERESIFSSLYGTDRWRQSMFRTSSQYMFVTAENASGERYVTIAKARDGKWKLNYCAKDDKVIAWLKTPKAYMGDCVNE